MAAKPSDRDAIEYTVINDRVYPLVEKVFPSKIPALKRCIERFVHKRHKDLYDYAPVDRMYWKQEDINDFFKSINIVEKEVSDILPRLYYWEEKEIQACKDEFSITCLMCLRYLLKERPNDAKMIELVSIYLAFSGKFYASCHYDFWEFYTPKREVMDYVVNYMLSNKFDLIRTKSVWGAIKSLTKTWIDKYKDELCDEISDEMVSYIFHQLYNRIHAFLKNISNAYYEAYNSKKYINAESDKFEKDDYRISNNNSTLITTITENTMIYFANNQINIAICFSVSTSGVDPYDVKSIFETIISDNRRLDDLRTVINIMLVDFNNKYPGEQDLTGPKFISNSITMKPNTKDKDILESKNIIIGWLNTSDRYKKIKTQATKNNYYKAILSYIALTVNIANKTLGA